MPALRVIDKNIVFYPGMVNRGDPQYLCDPTLSSASYISRETGLTAILKSQNVMEYDILCGMIYCSRRDWAKAREAFERIVTFPARENSMSKIMIDAYKRWILVNLLWKGAHSENPVPLGSFATKFYETLGKPYTTVATMFAADNAQALRAEVEANSQLWQEDGTVGLMREVLAAYQKWQVLGLQNVYSKISIAEVRRETRSAETGAPLPTDTDVEALVEGMIESEMLNGAIEKRKEDGGGGETSFLAFRAPTAALSEKDFADELARAALRLRELRPLVRATDDRLGTHKDYIRHVVKESKRENSSDPSGIGGGGLGGFQVEVDDEDLMGGIISTG